MRLKREVVLLMCLVFLISILPFISSAPPETTINFNFAGGLEITPQIQYLLEKGQNYTTDFFVFNKTDGRAITNTNPVCSCTYFLADNEGEIVYFSPVQYQAIGYWKIMVDGKNFTRLGTYNYGINCNTSTQGGSFVGLYEITNSGTELTEGRAIIDMGLLIVLIIFFVVCLMLFSKFEHLLARVGSLGIGYLLLIAISFVAWNMASDFLISAPFVISMFRIIFLVLVIGLFPLVIGGFAWYFIMLSRIKEIDDLMKHGISVSEAQERAGYKHGRNR